jgi:ATP-dependent Clp endopeptidase proteolytic subunit ClpP
MNDTMQASAPKFGETLKAVEPRSEILVRDPKVLEIANNRIYFYSEIDRASILTLNKNLHDMHSEHITFAQKTGIATPVPIRLHINSYGGSAFAGLAGMDEIAAVSKDVPIYTIVDGCCASAGTFLSIVGTKRYINKHAYMLIRQLSGVAWGKYEELKDEMLSIEKIMKMIKDLYKERTNLPEKKIEDILKHDIWFTAEECLHYGLVDEII